MNNLKIVFAGTPEISKIILKAIIDNGVMPIASMTQPDRPSGRGRKIVYSPVKSLSLEKNIPLFQFTSLRTPEAVQQIKELNPDLIIVIAYGLIFPKNILDIPKYGCLNIHMSLLPELRGASPIQYSLLNGDLKTGVTLIKMDEGMDTGDIYLKKECSISNKENSQTLHDKLAKLGSEAIVEFLNDFEVSHKNLKAQDHEKATYTKKIKKEDALINWDSNANEIINKIKAFNPWPKACTNLQNEQIKILDANEIDEPAPSNITAGTIIKVDKKNGIFVSTRNKVIQLNTIQLPNSKPTFSGNILDRKNLDIKEGTVLK